MSEQANRRPGPIRTKRVYDKAGPDDGFRVLVDRLWPRGVRKADAAIDDWMKEITPSNELRRWYHEQRGAGGGDSGGSGDSGRSGAGHSESEDDDAKPRGRAAAEFRTRFHAELAAPEARQALDALAERARAGTVTLVSAVRELEGSHVPVIADELRARLR